MKIFDKTKSFAPDTFFDIKKKNYFFMGKIAKNNKNGADSSEIRDSNPNCGCYCSTM